MSAQQFAATSLRRSLVIEFRVLHALLMREIITRFGRKNLGVLWLIGEPMIFTLGVATLWTLYGMHHSSAIPIVAFAVTGYSSVLMWRNSANRCGAAVEQNKALLFHRNVRVLDVILMRNLLETGGATCSFIVLGSFFVFIGSMTAPLDSLQVIFGWIMLAWFGNGLSMTIGAASSMSDVVERLWHPTAYLLFPLSGAGFMVDWLPTRLQPWVLILPMVHGTEMMRAGWFGNVVPTHYSVPYMAGANLTLTLLGLFLSREAGRRVEV